MKQVVVLLLISMLGMAHCLNAVQKRSLASTLSSYGVRLHDVAMKLAVHLHDGITVSACTAICQAGAVAILEGAALAAAIVCGPLCDYTLEHMQAYIQG